MQTNFHSELPPQFDKVPAIVNLGTGSQPLSFEAQTDLIYQQYAEILCHVSGDNHKTYFPVGQPNSDLVTWSDGATICETRSGRRVVMLSIDTGEIGTSKDSDGKTFETRIHDIRRAPSGQPVFSSRLVSLWLFVREFHPSPRWMTATQWEQILAECKPSLELDEAAEADDEKHRLAYAAQLRHAKASQLDPQGALARGIATGISEALKGLNLQPKAAK